MEKYDISKIKEGDVFKWRYEPSYAEKQHQSTQKEQRNQQCFAVQFVTRQKKNWEDYDNIKIQKV